MKLLEGNTFTGMKEIYGTKIANSQLMC